MPQMAPYNWLQLNFMFTLLMILIITIIHFIAPQNNFNSMLNLNKINYLYQNKW